jgi:hypothetical protein
LKNVHIYKNVQNLKILKKIKNVQKKCSNFNFVEIQKVHISKFLIFFKCLDFF